MNSIINIDNLENYQAIRSNCYKSLRVMLPELFLSCKKELKSTIIKGSDYVELKALCHKWKGFLPSYGLQGLGQVVINIEEKISEEIVDEELLKTIVKKVEKYLSQLVRESQ